jgi:prophage regulatory protein
MLKTRRKAVIGTGALRGAPESDTPLPDIPLPELLSRHEVARLTGLSPATVERYWREGHMPAPVRLGPNRVAWRRSELNEWIAGRQRVRGAAAAEAA